MKLRADKLEAEELLENMPDGCTLCDGNTTLFFFNYIYSSAENRKTWKSIFNNGNKEDNILFKRMIYIEEKYRTIALKAFIEESA